MSRTLYLMPVPLGDSPPDQVIPVYVLGLINQIDHYAVEDLRSARRYLKKAGIIKPIDELNFYLLNEHSHEADLDPILDVLKSGITIGLLSEAGVPAVADPGADLVRLAHKNDINVVPLSGPSSILMALMASGINGQNFCFHGYIPIKKPGRVQALKLIEKQARDTGGTQIFMETPYRNMSLLEDIIGTCNEEMRLCIAADITLPGEFIKTRSVREWRDKLPDLHKRPTVFLLGSAL
jgi:16S rRNA (cytidine1402-2'-O)-methyltransferase